MRTIQLTVEGMRCRRCVRQATALLRDVPGIATLTADPGTSRITLIGDVTDQAVLEALAGTTFTVRITTTPPFEVVPWVVPDWPGITDAGRVVARFLAEVRVTGDEAAADRVMAPIVACHQVVSEAPATIRRTPRDYARHVREMLTASGPFRYVVTELLADGDRVYVRWSQHGHDLIAPDGSPGTGREITEVGSAVYRVERDRIAEYWIQLDRLGLVEQRRGG